jgi:sialate O-acetylesterase
MRAAKILVSSVFVLLFVFQSAFGQIKIPVLLSNGMVLQRNIDLKIWGWAEPNEKVTLNFQNKTYTAQPGSDRKWEIVLPPMDAGGPYEMEIKGSNQITLKNILVGDVWVCSGQSNMEYPIERLKEKYPDEIANSANSNIRQFLVPQKYDFHNPQENFAAGNWEESNPQTVMKFTAVGYFFAKDLYKKYKVPIGLINASLGGAPVQAFMSRDALKDFPEYLQTADKFTDEYIKEIEAKDKAVSDEWYGKLNELDKGLIEKWFDVNYVPEGWLTMDVPGYWADGKLGNVNGAVWFRKEIDVPAAMTGKDAKIELGRIVDADTVYINGKIVGTTSYQYPRRIYYFGANILKAGKNIIVIRVIHNTGRGGFVLDKPYEITTAGEKIDLKGKWQYKLGTKMDALAGQTFVRWSPTGLYNGMIAPLTNYKIKGVIWYQGESNTGKPQEYQKLFSTLITNWRKDWHDGDFPFLYVQLANFMDEQKQPSESNWAMLREAQLKTLTLPNTAMAVITDIGEWNDIHPLNKKDVGKRLSLAAQNIAYGEKYVVYSGPIYKSIKFDGSKIIISFTNIGSGLVAKDGELKHFAVAGADKKFVWANAKIDGDKVIIWSDDVSYPIAVRYAWADNPQSANLYNNEGLPASAFRTDK